MKKLLIAAVVVIAASIVIVAERHRLVIYFLGTGSPPDLLNASDEGPGVDWHDDYYVIQALDPSTFAIGEPRYVQQNVNYLIVGTERAILFDAGSGYRDIRPVAKALTDRPITFVPSHFHFDHIGNSIPFEHVAIVDLPHIRSRVQNGKLQLTWAEHVGSIEGYDPPALRVDEWLTPNSTIDLGERQLQVLYTPGHTDDSISLLDSKSGYLFSGDFLYTGTLFGFLPNSGMGDYLQGVETVLDATTQQSRIFGAHRVGPPGIPEQTIADVHDLENALRAIKAGELKGEGFYPVTYIVNASVQLLAEPSWLQRWERRYPQMQVRDTR